MDRVQEHTEDLVVDKLHEYFGSQCIDQSTQVSLRNAITGWRRRGDSKKKKKEKNEISTGARKQEEAREKRGMLERFTSFLSDSISVLEF